VTRPWVRLYRREEGSFGQLPLYVRALAKQLLVLTDDHGVIRIGNREPADAIAFALGATRGDRRMLARDISLLIADGYLIHDGDALRVRKFRMRQFDDGVTTEPRSDHGSVTNEQRSDHDGATKQEVKARDPSLPENCLQIQNREEQNRAEKKGPPGSPPEAAPPEPSGPSESEQISEIERRYPAGLCAEARAGCALSRRTNRLADSVWLRTLRQLERLPASTATAAMRLFVERYADGDKGETYLVGIARREAKRGGKGVAPPTSHADFEASYDPERDDPDLAWREAANA
jgi:hypothetical protein